MSHVTLSLLAVLSSCLISSVTAAQRLDVKQTAETIVVRQDGRVVLTYRKRSPQVPPGIDPIYRRSGFLHPVRSPRGESVTAMFPFDHPHQQGIFSAWVKTTYDGQSIDFWNAARETGTVFHDRVVSIFNEQETAGFEVDLIHRAVREKPIDILHERWRITVHETEKNFHCFDLESEQSALTDKPLVVEKYHYGGLAVRGPTRWLLPEDRGLAERDGHVRSPSGFLNDLRSNRVEGNHQRARWVALWGELDGKPVSIAVLSHADNFRAPQAARLHPTKPYFCFAPCVDDSFVIDQEHPLVAKYRFLVSDTMPDPEWIDKRWESWCGQAGL